MHIRFLMPAFAAFACLIPAPLYARNMKPAAQQALKVTSGDVTIPTYDPVGRYMEPPLFQDSTLTGLYPFTTYKRTFQKGDPKPVKYPAVFVENQYLKLTYIPQLGGRFFALYDKVHQREVFYRNDVIKPTQFSPRFNWPQSGIEITGPYDAHTLTLHNEPFWSHTILKHADGSVSVMLGEVDPIYHMHVTFTATLYPEVDALEISTYCYNGNDEQKPQMLWSNAAFPVTEKLRFIYPMAQTVGHTTGVVSPWPVYEGVDLSWAKNNTHMLGVFGIDSYDNFGGAYEFAQDYGVFRYADRRVVQGMKMWTFGFGAGSSEVEHSYTDKAGPYYEAQSGRMVWDGHYEWVFPHAAEQWHEWWVPVAGIGGLTTMTANVALHVEDDVAPSETTSTLRVALSPIRPFQHACLVITAGNRMLLDTKVDLEPGKPVIRSVPQTTPQTTPQTGPQTTHQAPPESASAQQAFSALEVRLTSQAGETLLDYRQPQKAEGGDVTPFAKGLLDAPVPPEKMTAEQLVLAARFKQKDLNFTDAEALAKKALVVDPGYSSAHQLLGMLAFDRADYQSAERDFEAATERDPYDSQSWYHLSICEMRLGKTAQAERNLYYIWPGSAYYSAREYQLGRMALLTSDGKAAIQHLLGAVRTNGEDLKAHLLLAMVYREQKDRAAALQQLQQASALDPASRIGQAEMYFLTGSDSARQDLHRLMGGQSEEAIEVSLFYADVDRWNDASSILKMVEDPHNQDPWGTGPIFYYTLAYDLMKGGDASAAAAYQTKAQAAQGNVERFPYRMQSVAPLTYAVEHDPRDTVARLNLGFLLYSLDRHSEAIAQWQQVITLDPNNFEAQRALGLAWEQQGRTAQALGPLKQAVALEPNSAVTVDDLADLYARTGDFAEQLALLQQALQRSPEDDHLEESILKANLLQGDFQAAQRIIEQHTFEPVHRTYSLRDEYRQLKSGLGAVAFNRGDYGAALDFFQQALTPPSSMGLDDFEHQSAARIHYYLGRTLEAMGKREEARKAYQESAGTVSELTGGGSDSWTPDNFFALFALRKLGRQAQADALVKQFQLVANARVESADAMYSARAHYLSGLIDQYEGHTTQAKEEWRQALQLEPDYIDPRFEISGRALPVEESANTKP